MKEIHTTQGWRKVRKLSRWREIVPDWIYIIGLVISFYFVFIENNRSKWWIMLLIICIYKTGTREGHEEGYVDGWGEGQSYVTGTYTMDELLKAGKTKENEEIQPPTSDNSNYRK